MSYKKTSESEITWRSVRSEFELDPNLVHLAPMLFSSHPRPVRKAIEEYRREMDRNPKYAHDKLESNCERVLRAAAKFFCCSPNHIALTDSTTMGLGLILTGLDLKDEDEILQSHHGHYSSDAAIGFAERRYKSERVKTLLYDSGALQSASEDSIVNNLIDGLTDLTRLVVVTWVHSSTGVKLPLKRIAKKIRQVNKTREPERQILLVVDGVHALGVEDFKLNDKLCDFFIAGCHKTLCGPRGTGVLWGTPQAWDCVRRTIPPFGKDLIEMWRKDQKDTSSAIGRLMTPGGYHSYEHRWALADAFEFQMSIGKKRISKRLRRLARICKRELTELKSVDLLTPMNSRLSSGMVCFRVKGKEPKDVEAQLESKGIIASASPYREPCVRFSMGLYTTREDIQAGVRAVSELA